MRVWPATFLLLMSAACAPPQTRGPDALTEVRAVWTAQVEAWNRGDLDGFVAGYWKSPDLVFFSNGAETRGFMATIRRSKSARQLPSAEWFYGRAIRSAVLPGARNTGLENH